MWQAISGLGKHSRDAVTLFRSVPQLLYELFAAAHGAASLAGVRSRSPLIGGIGDDDRDRLPFSGERWLRSYRPFGECTAQHKDSVMSNRIAWSGASCRRAPTCL